MNNTAAARARKKRHARAIGVERLRLRQWARSVVSVPAHMSTRRAVKLATGADIGKS